MTNDDTGPRSSGETKRQVRAVIERNEDIRGQVRDIVIAALARQDLDKESIKKTIGSVLEGAIEAAPESHQDLAQVMKKTVEGLDDAMAKAAEASKLAIAEAQGRVGEFSEHDLKRAAKDLIELESLFFETLTDLANAGHSTAGTVLRDIIAHTKRTGTDIGKTVSDSLQALQGPLSRAGRPDLAQIEKAARVGTASLASIASGILAGIADSLRSERQQPGKDPSKKAD